MTIKIPPYRKIAQQGQNARTSYHYCLIKDKALDVKDDIGHVSPMQKSFIRFCFFFMGSQ